MFFVGDKVKNSMRDRSGVVEGFKNDSLLFVNYGNGPEVTSPKNLVLLSKVTDIRLALRDDPTSVQHFAEHFKATGRIMISCQASRVDKLANDLSAVSGLSELEAVDYISPASERTHAAKFYVLVSKDAINGLFARLGVFFDILKTGENEVQINSRSLAEWLMREHNILPQKRDRLERLSSSSMD
jgi:hypothetical protein